MPFLHGFVGWQAWPAVHDMQLPVLHTRFVPHGVPSATLVLLSVHTGLPVVHDSVPLWQGLAGTHAAPAVHVVQLPLVHTMLVPQLVPFGRLPDSAHTGEPVAQVVAPVLHTLAGWQAEPAAQAPHDPGVAHAVGAAAGAVGKVAAGVAAADGRRADGDAGVARVGGDARGSRGARDAGARLADRSLPHTLPLG